MMLKNKTKNVHMNRLFDSKPDDVALAQAVQERFIELCETYFRVHQVQLVFPTALNRDVLLWREMRCRHMKRDYRNTLDEMRAVKRIAEWTLRVKKELCGQKSHGIEWAD